MSDSIGITAALGLTVLTLSFPDPGYFGILQENFKPVDTSLSFSLQENSKIRTLSTTASSPGEDLDGLLYVPTLHRGQCPEAAGLIPVNATRRVNLPDTNSINLIALAPWINPSCTLAYMAAAQMDPVKTFIFYLPDNSTAIPPLANNARWSIGDGGRWKTTYRYPVFAISGSTGGLIMQNLAYYSDNVTNMPNGEILSQHIDPRSYIRLAAEVEVSGHNSLPSLWVFLLIVLGILIMIIAVTSFFLQWLQRKRREALRRRVISGEVDIEALGIRRVTVPASVLQQMPLYTFVSDNAVPKSSSDTSTQSSPPTSSPAPLEPPSSKPEAPSSNPNNPNSPTNPIASQPSPLPPADPPLSEPSKELPPHPAPFSQPTCAICLDDFTPYETRIRELPCHHIFHPECIDPFLRQNSSLCPMCKLSVLPADYSPPITNAMVRRERLLRRMRRNLHPHDPPSIREVLRFPRSVVRSSSGAGTGAVAPVLPTTEVPAPVRVRPPSSGGTSLAPPDSAAALRAQGAEIRERMLEAEAARAPVWRKVVGKMWPRLG
ncbi:hypothetical protein EJ06DRAFT_555432 [Trichodelitschia bisporula]|uniref:RING-type domain-containing protein n=1 Tax=Trichodelitschia bisporula TaxID=703511 RepID=A0A6G1I0R4_9PEZI|nr:hypothetical protein EJ06DRAFT_555432 [Trichodelitschia bisporula]